MLSRLHSGLTRPVAPQHASLASNITTFRFSSGYSSRRWKADDAPHIPLPMMTTSAFVGRDGVVRWPSRTLDGALCQKDFVEFGVGKLALPDGSAPKVMVI